MGGAGPASDGPATFALADVLEGAPLIPDRWAAADAAAPDATAPGATTKVAPDLLDCRVTVESATETRPVLDMEPVAPKPAAELVPPVFPHRRTDLDETQRSADAWRARKNQVIEERTVESGAAADGAERMAEDGSPEIREYPAGGPAVRLAKAVALDLPESAVLSGARVTLGGIKDGAAERLLYDLTGTRILANREFDPFSDKLVLVFERADTVANYRHVLGSVRYLNGADEPSLGPRTAIFEAFDETGRANVLHVAAMSVVPALEMPDAAPIDLFEGAEISIVPGTDSDILAFDAQSDTVVSVDIAPHGALSVPAWRLVPEAETGTLDTESYSYTRDTAETGLLARLSAARTEAAEHVETVFGAEGISAFHPDGMLALGGEHDLYGDLAGTRLSFAGALGEADLGDAGGYRVFPAAETDALFDGTAATPANENAADGAQDGGGSALSDFGLAETTLFEDDVVGQAKAAAPGGGAPAFENVLISPLATDDDVIDTGVPALSA